MHQDVSHRGALRPRRKGIHLFFSDDLSKNISFSKPTVIAQSACSPVSKGRAARRRSLILMVSKGTTVSEPITDAL
jgi:hypothetical protein